MKALFTATALFVATFSMNATNSPNCNSGCKTTYNNHVGTLNLQFNSNQSEANKTYCITGTFNGSLNVRNAKVRICGNATITSWTFDQNSSVEITSGAVVTVQNSGGMNSTSNFIKNWGSLTFTNGFSPNNDFYNYGTVAVNGGDLNINSSAAYHNYGSISVNQGSFNHNSPCGLNSGSLYASKDIKLNGGSAMVNCCSMISGEEFHINIQFENNDYAKAGTKLYINGGSKLKLDTQAMMSTNELILNGTVQGYGSSNTLKVTGPTLANGGSSFTGPVEACLGGTISGTPTYSSGAAASCNNTIPTSSCNPEGFSPQPQPGTCELTKTNGGGFTTSIKSVVDNCDNTYTIVLKVQHNGCSGNTCKSLSHLSIEALPGTYSGATWSTKSGTASYGSYANGPNLGASTPFQGFKFDNTSNFGGGKAGVVEITYTLTALQSQRVSAKAGTGTQIASFTVADFQAVMNCANTVCQQAPDGDNDGCEDAVDQYPNDPTRCYDVSYPSAGVATLAYEDLWPAAGDYDFNDLVLDYQFTAELSGANEVNALDAVFVIRAFGAGFHNGFGFQFANPQFDGSNMQVTGSEISSPLVSLGANGLELGQSKATVIVFTDAYGQMRHPGVGIGVNTETNTPYVQPDTLRMRIVFTSNKPSMADLDLANFNPFLIAKQDRGREIHLPGYAPTDLADPSYYGLGDDDSNPGAGRTYVTETNLPWALHLPVRFDYPTEKTDIVTAHLKFAAWVMSGGLSFPDWYLDMPGYRNAENLY